MTLNRTINPTDGFTLIELIVVMLILMTLAAMVVPMLGQARDTEAMAAINKVVADVGYAQSEALRGQAPVTVAFSQSTQRYTLTGNSGTLTDPVTKAPYVVDLRDVTGAHELEISYVDFGATASLGFNSVGEPVKGGTNTPISNDSRVTVQNGRFAYTMEITPLTGKISVRSGT
jgi:prepilin-type N-terminal cleavage/methylation domain-containing protein